MKSQEYYSTYQLKLSEDIERIIEISDPVYTFCEVLDSMTDFVGLFLMKNCGTFCSKALRSKTFSKIWQEVPPFFIQTRAVSAVLPEPRKCNPPKA